MLADDVITEVTEPTDLVNTIVCSIKETPDGKKRVRFHRNISNFTEIADCIIVSGTTEQERDQAFVRVLETTRANNVSLNSEKLQFKKQQVNFYGNMLTIEGITSADDMLEAIKNISTPSNAKEFLSLLGMVTYLNRFSPRIAALTAPLRKLTEKNTHFKWEQSHLTALDKINEELCNSQVISYYDPNPSTTCTTIPQCDASQEGLGALLRQLKPNGGERIVAIASRSLTTTESRCSHIERKCLAVMYGLEKFEYYTMGRHILVETDH